MGSALTIANTHKPIVARSVRSIDYAAAMKGAENYAGSDSRMFPGQALNFKQGEWFFGFGDNKSKIEAKTRFIFNMPNMVFTWQRFEDGANGKPKPKTLPPRSMALGETLISRAELGDTDQDEWEVDDKNIPQDPWRELVVCPIRTEDTEEVDHCIMSAKSHNMAFVRAMQAWAKEGQSKIGLLPVYEIDTNKVEMKKKNAKTGKEQTFKWDVPVFKLVDWVDAEEVDNPPNGGGVRVTDDEPAVETGEVESKGRVVVETKPRKATASSKPPVEHGADEFDDEPIQEVPSKVASRPVPKGGRVRREIEA